MNSNIAFSDYLRAYHAALEESIPLDSPELLQTPLHLGAPQQSNPLGPSQQAPIQQGSYTEQINVNAEAGPSRGTEISKAPASAPSKRQQSHTIKACNVCRRRKIKCDGKKPVCSSCAIGERDCNWDKEPDRRRVPSLAYVESLKRANTISEATIKELRRENEALRRRLGEPSPRSDGASRQSRKNVLGEGEEDEDDGMNDSEDDAVVESLSHTVNRLKLVDSEGGIRHFGPTSTFALLPESYSDEDSPAQMASNSNPLGTWMVDGNSPEYDNVMAMLPEELELTPELHEQLLDLYEAYFAPWCMVVDMKAFRHDLSKNTTHRRTDDYSPMLHNAILGNACRFSKDVPTNAEALFAEKGTSFALQECKRPVFSTVRGLAALGSLHTVLGREDLSSLYFGMALRISESLGLQLDCSQYVRSGHLTTSQKQSRDSLFWTMFVLDKLQCTAVGRAPSMTASSVPLYQVDAEVDLRLWSSRASTGRPVQPSVPCYTSSVFKQTCLLLMIAADINLHLYSLKADTRRKHGQSMAARLRVRLQAWKDELPVETQLNELAMQRPLPTVLLLHMYYWLLVILVYRLDSHGRLHHTSGDATAIAASDAAALEILNLLELYETHIGIRYGPLTSTHIAYTAASVLLMSIIGPNASADHQKSRLISFDKCLHVIGQMNHVWANQTHQVLLGLRNDWIQDTSTTTVPVTANEVTLAPGVINSEDVVFTMDESFDPFSLDLSAPFGAFPSAYAGQLPSYLPGSSSNETPDWMDHFWDASLLPNSDQFHAFQ